ncbi:MAG: DUF362 domain-containing protein [Magnetococcales bacterium]|nr:DUF362 domain-containing protein [Magnetococcales bacterium]
MTSARSRKKSDLKRVAPLLTRRQFVGQVAVTGGIAAALGVGGWLAYSDQPVRHKPEVIHRWRDYRVTPSDLHARLAVVRGTDVEPMAREALAGLGGMERFIARGDKVLLKPNVGWDRQPEQAANTGPELVAAMIKLCREAGAAEVWVSDVSLNDPYRCFFRSGIQAVAEAGGARVRIPGREDFVITDMGGSLLRHWPVARFFHEADKLINLPIVKHHSLSGATLAMKNWYGVIGGTRNRLHQDINTSIVELAAAVRPTLTVMDATRVLKRNGPTGGSLADVSRENTLIAGLDEVAIDAWSLGLLDLTPEAVPWLTLAAGRGLGVVDWRSLRVHERQVG